MTLLLLLLLHDGFFFSPNKRVWPCWSNKCQGRTLFMPLQLRGHRCVHLELCVINLQWTTQEERSKPTHPGWVPWLNEAHSTPIHHLLSISWVAIYFSCPDCPLKPLSCSVISRHLNSARIATHLYHQLQPDRISSWVLHFRLPTSSFYLHEQVEHHKWGVNGKR